MYDDHHHDSKHVPTETATGYDAVKKHGLIDDPRFSPAAPAPFNPEWRNKAAGDENIIVTDGRHFSSTLDRLNIQLGHDYDCWAPVGERLVNAFRTVYGADGTHTPVSRMPECQTAFIAAAGASLREWMDQTQRHTVENRTLYRGLIQELAWVRKGSIKPR